ncbi:MAG: carbon-nitrogen family hydrolase [Oligoflexia bacterium]|nr:carbon-nitrogen family hydrolase [Oligoflexia bacterium]
MRIAAAQFDIAWNDPSANFDRIADLAAQASLERPDLFLLPETFSTGFSLLTGQPAAEAGVASEKFLQDLSAQYSFAVAGSHVAAAPLGRAFNQLSIFQHGECLAKYQKMHLFGFGGEKETFQAGQQVLTLTISGARCTFFICYDLRFPVPFSRTAQHSDCYLVVANWPSTRIHHWSCLLQARAIENQAYVLGLNRIGAGGNLQYNGQSACFSPTGDRVAYAESRDGLLVVDITPATVLDYRQKFPLLQDRVAGIDN